MSRIRFAIRALAKTPVVTLVVVLSLGLGIGANTAIFSLLYQMILSALPVPHPEQLVILNSPGEFKSGRTAANAAGGVDSIFSYRVFRELEKHPQGVSAVVGFRALSANLASGNQTLNGSVMLVSGGYFPTLNVQPLMGRTINSTDDVHGAGQPVVVLGYGYWKDRLGGRTDVLNQEIRVNGHPFTVAGVLPSTFTGTVLGDEPDVFVPLSFKKLMTPGWDGTDKYNDHWMYLLARLKPGVTRAQAETALNVVYAGLVEQQAKMIERPDADYIRRFQKSRLSLKDGSQGQSSLRTGSRVPIFTLMAATAMVLLIAMANAVNLLLARSAQRRKELAIRTALGAGRLDIVWELLTEALLLAIAGGVAGLMLGWWTLSFLIAQVARTDAPSHFLSTQLDWPILLFATSVSLAAGLLVGLYPAWDASRSTPASTLRELAGSTSASQSAARVRKLLVCAQVTISAVLLIPTGLFLKSLVNLLRVDLGLRTENVITFHVSPELNGYKAGQSRALFERVESEMASIPGVRSVTEALVPLIGNSNWGQNLTVDGFSRDPNADNVSLFNLVGGGFFNKMGIPLVAGRDFTDNDGRAGGNVAIVNETWVKHFVPSGNVLGRRFAAGVDEKNLDTEIIGIVKDSKYSNVKQKPQRVYYVAWRQSKDIGELSFYIRTALPTAQVVPQVRRVMMSIDRNLPLEGLRTLEEQVSRNIQSDRLVLQLAAAFAVIATLLAMLGLYGIMAYSVTRRTREIGIRMALGASADRIRVMVMRELLVILASGLMVGIAVALGLVRYVKSQLFGVEAYDLGIIAGAVFALTIAAVLAGYLPARRATRVSPTNALRYE